MQASAELEVHKLLVDELQKCSVEEELMQLQNQLNAKEAELQQANAQINSLRKADANSVTAAVAPASPADQVQPQYIDASHEQSLRQAEDIPYAFESLPFKVDCPFVILVC